MTKIQYFFVLRVEKDFISRIVFRDFLHKYVIYGMLEKTKIK